MLQSAVGTIAMTPVAGQLSVTGLGFQPVLVIFMSQPDTANIVTEIANGHLTYGAFDGTDMWMLRQGCTNGAAFGDVMSMSASLSKVFQVHDPPHSYTPDYSVAGFSLDADGFTIDIVDPPPINYRFSFLALGGATLLAKVGHFTSSGGGDVITGLGFSPEVVLTAGIGITGVTPLPANAQGSTIFLGASMGGGFVPAVNWAIGNSSGYNSSPANVHKHFNNGWPISLIGTAGNNMVGGGISTLDLDGFTTAYYANPTGYHLFYIALRGAPDIFFATGSDTLPAAVGPKTVSGFSFYPHAGLFASIGNPAAGFFNNAEFSLGFAGGSVLTQAMNNYKDILKPMPSVSSHGSRDDRILRFMAPTSGAIQEDVELQTFGNMDFTVNSLVANGSAFSYLVIGDMNGPYVPQPPTSNNYGVVV